MQRKTTTTIAFLLLFAACSLTTKGIFYPPEDGTSDADGIDIEIDVTADDDAADDGVPDEIEIPPGCGDGELDDGEECDDGNDVAGDGCEPDCTFSCHDNGDCADGDPCNGDETCSPDSHMCEAGGAREDGFVCGEDPRSICLEGACAASACGDGFVDEGGGEFCEPALDERCNEDCTFSCTVDAECPDDDEECNGEEYCDTGVFTCDRRNAPAEGSACELSAGERRICIGETCQASTCGDAFVDDGAEPAEECDDGNDENGDGCENDCTFSCRVNTDCSDNQVCNGSETCDGATHTCTAGTNAPSGTTCDDGLFCTEEDECDGDGGCAGTGDICDDRLVCTTDTCDETSNSCSNVIVADHCVIAGVCYFRGTLNPTNPCQACRPAVSTSSWSAVDDMTPCSTGTGVCCAGACRTGGVCCASTDCPMACSGLPAPCSDFENPTDCDGQSGCRWAVSIDGCTGTLNCWNIDGVPISTCIPICGCSGQGCVGPPMVCDCTGTSSLGCDDLDNQGDCEICGCAWGTGTAECTGVPDRCGTFGTEPDCLGQTGCSWARQTCDPFSYVCL